MEVNVEHGRAGRPALRIILSLTVRSRARAPQVSPLPLVGNRGLARTLTIRTPSRPWAFGYVNASFPEGPPERLAWGPAQDRQAELRHGLTPTITLTGKQTGNPAENRARLPPISNHAGIGAALTYLYALYITDRKYFYRVGWCLPFIEKKINF